MEMSERPAHAHERSRDEAVESVVRSRIAHAFFDGRWDLLAYSILVRLKGLDLKGESQEEIGIDRCCGNEYADSGGPDLVRVLKTFNVSSQDRILDLGSGKGGALFAMSRFPFAEILGIELSERMVDVARQNAVRLGARNVHSICADASTFTDLDRFNYVYMFNPFPANVISKVMYNLATSIRHQPRKITLIYKYPGCPDELVDQAIFYKQTKIHLKGSHPFSIYSSRATL